MEYEIIGEKRFVEGKMYYAPGETDNGFCYKNEQAFKENPDDVCYIPEAYFEGIEPAFTEGDKFSRDFKEFFSEDDIDTINRREIEEDCEGYVDCEDEAIDPELLFQELDWMCPSTLINEYDFVGQIILE